MLTNETIQKIRELRKGKGLSYTEIGKLLGVSRKTATRHSKDIELPPKGPKTCSKCRKSESETTFYKRGLVCKQCHKIWRKQHYTDNKQYYVNKARRQQDKFKAYIKTYKASNPCADCDKYFPSCVMDFDHLRDKAFLISKAHRIISSIVSLKKEMAKCELVCSNCHRLRSQTRLEEKYKNFSSSS